MTQVLGFYKRLLEALVAQPPSICEGAPAGAPFGPRPLENFEVPVFGSRDARPVVPGAPVGPRPLEDLEMLVLGSNRARDFATGLPVGARPLQDREVPACCRKTAERLRRSFRR